jgi:hypothetical protein
MYRSLLAPLDGSSSAEQALPVASSIARSAGAALNLLCVQVPFPPIDGDGHLQNLLEADAREKARAYLDEVVQRIAAATHFAANAAARRAGRRNALPDPRWTRPRLKLICIVPHSGSLTRR